jgi:hypothetical protein
MRQGGLPDHPTALGLIDQVFFGFVFTAAHDMSVTLGPSFKCVTHFYPFLKYKVWNFYYAYCNIAS